MSLSRYEGLRCQNVTFCPFCLCGEPQLSLHLLFWPFGSLKERLLFDLPLTFVLPLEWGDQFFSLSRLLFKVLFQEADKKASSGGILNENKNQLGHGLVKIWAAVVWRSQRKKGACRWLEAKEKKHANQICSGVFFEVKIMVLCAPEYF